MRKGGGGLGKCDPTFFYQMHNLINSSLLVDFLLIIDNNIRLLDLQLKHKGANLGHSKKNPVTLSPPVSRISAALKKFFFILISVIICTQFALFSFIISKIFIQLGGEPPRPPF